MDNLENSESIANSRSFEAKEPQDANASGKNLTIIQRIFISFLTREKSLQENTPRKICLHKENADKIRLELEKAKEDLKRKLDQELLPMITEVIDPLLREIERINRFMKKDEGEELTSLQFKVWTEGAKLWVELYSKRWDRDMIKAEIVRHIIDKSIQKIEKDIRFIESYFEQSLEQLELSPQETEGVRQFKGKFLSKYLDRMRDLKTPPMHPLTFEEVASWRQQLDEERSMLHDAALHLIDE